MKKLSNTEAELTKSIAYKKACNIYSLWYTFVIVGFGQLFPHLETIYRIINMTSNSH